MSFRSVQNPAANTPLKSPLLGLPGELRNKIYEYALTSARPLIFTKRIHEDGFAAAVLALSSSSKATELDDPIHCSTFNRLKYVNQQLYQETSGLEVKYNTVCFIPGRGLSPIDKVRKFVTYMPVVKQEWLTKIMLVGTDSCLEHTATSQEASCEDLPTVIAFCKQYPHIQVQYVYLNLVYNKLPEEEIRAANKHKLLTPARNYTFIPEMTDEDSALRFQIAAISLLVAFNYEEKAAPLLVGFQGANFSIREAQQWREQNDFPRLLQGVRNFTIMPDMTTTDPQLFHGLDIFDPAVENDEQNWTDFANSLIEHGISPEY